MKAYTIEVNFGGYIGTEKMYIVDADSEEEAIEIAREEALDDLDIKVIGEEEI